MLSFRRRMYFLSLAFGVLVSFTGYGILQEKIFRGRFGQELQPHGKVGETFKYPIIFETIQYAANALAAKVLMLTHDHPKNEIDQRFYLVAGIFNICAKVFAHWSMFFVPFSVQVIAKAPKPIPIMVLGYFFAKKRYTLRKVALVVAIVAGIMLFMYKDTEEEFDGDNLIIGNIILFFSLFADGATGATEDRMRSIRKPTVLQLMYYVNCYSVLVGIIGIITFNEAPRCLKFILVHPDILPYCGLCLLVTIVGQFFRNALVANFGALPMSIIATVRKFVSVFLSVILFGNPLLVRQWVAAGIIFGSLFLDTIWSKKPKQKKIDEEKPQEVAPADNSKRIEVFVIDDPNNNANLNKN